jgi:hypothetical protein
MLSLRVVLVAPLILASPVMAQGTQQGTQQGVRNQQQTIITGQRGPVATRPSNNPFQDPIGQGVPPAVSTNPNMNSNRTNVR